MRMCKKRMLSFILTLALIVSCFAGTGMTVKAAVPYIQSVSSSVQSLECGGGDVTITVKGLDFGEKFWYVVEKKEGSNPKETVGEELNEIAINGSPVNILLKIAANSSTEEVKYTIRVNGTEPEQKWDGSYYWDASVSFTVKGKEGGTPAAANKKALQAAIDAVPSSENEVDYTPETWQALQTALTAAQTVLAKDDATQTEVDDATTALTEATAALKKIEANITNMTVSETTVPAEETTTVDVQVEGTNLKEDNWGLDVKKYYKSSDFEASGNRHGKIEVSEKTIDTAKIKIYPSTYKDDLDIKVVAGSINEAGEITPQQEKVIIQSGYKLATLTVKLVDEDGKLVTDSSLGLSSVDLNPDFANPTHKSLSAGLEAGQFIFDVSDSNAANYKISLDENSSGYTADPITVNVANNYKITNVNTAVYDGNPVEMVVKKKSSGDNPPEGDPEITGITLSPNSLGSEGGTVKVTVAGTNLKSPLWYQVRKRTELIDGNPVYETNAEVKSATITASENPEFSIQIPANTESEDAVYHIRVSDAKETIKAGKGTTITVAGTGQSGVKADKTALKAAIADAKSKKAEDYEVDTWTQMQTELQAAEAIDEKETATQAEVDTATSKLQAALNALVQKTVKVTGVTATPTQIPANGGTVQLFVTGENLTESNWGVDVKKFISGTDVLATGLTGEATVKEITENGATIEISANGMKNDIDFVFSVGPKSGDAVTKQKEVTITQAKKTYSTIALLPESVVLADEHTVVAEFRESDPAVLVVDGVDLKKLIYIEGANGENRYNLTDEGTITADNHKVIITFSQALENINATSKLYIKEGALSAVVKENGKDEVKILKEIGWNIQSTPRVSGITVDKDLFDHQGGTVTATLNGYKVEEIDLAKIAASVYLPGETQATDIAVTKAKDDDGKPILTFTVPANNTQNTISYWLNVKYNGSPVYESAADSRGQRTAISVLPEGKTDKDVTLSKVTISGNNKIDEDANNTTDIAVDVVNNIGELKTELRVYGTNLDSKLTKVRAIDENGIVWPVYQISECDGTWRFIAIAGPHRNGVFGDGNSQLIELLPPRYAGTNKTYKIQVALDGKNFIEEPCVTLKVNNEGIKGEADFRDCTANNFKYVTVNYVDEKGNALAEKDVYKGYSISMPEGFGIAPKQISGYQLIKEPKLDEWVNEGRTYNYVYRSLSAVNNVKVSGIKLSAVSGKVAAGKKIQMTATVSPANATNKAVTYKSSNTKYATVNASGKVTVKKAGAGKTVTITATAADGSGKSASYKIKIMKNAVKSVKVKAAKSVKAGKKIKAKATVKTTGKKVNKTLKWTSSNTQYATVSSKGVIKTKKAGKGKTVKITATATDGSNKKSTVKIKIK